MPIYEYRCQDCSTEFEKLILAGFAEQVRCPRCGGDKAAKLFSTFGLVRGAPFASPSATQSCCAAGGCRCRH